jgi:hypothetical protein
VRMVAEGGWMSSAKEADRDRGDSRGRKLGCPSNQGLEVIQKGSRCIRK